MKWAVMPKSISKESDKIRLITQALTHKSSPEDSITKYSSQTRNKSLIFLYQRCRDKVIFIDNLRFGDEAHFYMSGYINNKKFHSLGIF